LALKVLWLVEAGLVAALRAEEQKICITRRNPVSDWFSDLDGRGARGRILNSGSPSRDVS
jgi:hypothetical protein